MRLLDRYLLKELFVPLAFCLCGFIVFFLSMDVFAQLEDFQEHRLRVLDVLLYYLIILPEMLVVVIPVTLLLALLFSLTQLSRHHELIAMRAAGQSLWRLSIPYLAIGVLFSFVLFTVSEFWLTQSEERAEKLLHKYTQPEASSDPWLYNLTFYNSRDERLWHIGSYNPNTQRMREIQVDWTQPGGSRKQLFAESGIYTNRQWVFRSVKEFTYGAQTESEEEDRIQKLAGYVPEQFDELALPEFTESPAHIQSEIKISRLTSLKRAKKAQLSIAELQNYLELNTDLNPERHDLLLTKLHERFAMPWTCLVVVFIAVPFGALPGRRNVFVGVASSIFICFAYYVLKELALALGTGGTVPPWLAAWMPNLIFGGIGATLIHKLQ